MGEKSENVYDAQQWGVHVSGPDSVLAARSFEEAVEQCERINRNIVKHIKPESDSLVCPLIWAKVELWADISKGAHEPEKTDWDEIC